MKAIHQVDVRRLPWVSHADSQVALVAATLPAAHDEGHRLSVRLLKRFKEQVLAMADDPAALSNSDLLHAVRSSFSGLSGLDGWGLHFGVAVVAEERWRIWTAGLVYCARWAPGEWKPITEPQSAARQLRGQSARDSSGFADDVAVKVARLSTAPEDIEHAEVIREAMTGVVLVGSVKAGRLLEAAACDPSWRLTSADEVLDATAPMAPGSPVATFAAFIG